MDPEAPDEPSREDLESRVAELEQTVSKMLPDRRGVLKGLGAAALGGAAVGGATGGASGQSAAGQVGTESEPVDVEGAQGNFDSVNTDKAKVNSADGVILETFTENQVSHKSASGSNAAGNLVLEEYNSDSEKKLEIGFYPSGYQISTTRGVGEPIEFMPQSGEMSLITNNNDSTTNNLFEVRQPSDAAGFVRGYNNDSNITDYPQGAYLQQRGPDPMVLETYNDNDIVINRNQREVMTFEYDGTYDQIGLFGVTPVTDLHMNVRNGGTFRMENGKDNQGDSELTGRLEFFSSDSGIDDVTGYIEAQSTDFGQTYQTSIGASPSTTTAAEDALVLGGTDRVVEFGNSWTPKFSVTQTSDPRSDTTVDEWLEVETPNGTRYINAYA